MHVLITGGAGFIGSNLVRSFSSRSEIDKLSVVDDISTGDRARLDGLDVDVHEGSVLDQDLLDRTFTGVDAVVHLAGLASVRHSISDPMTAHLVNVTGTVKVLQAARRAGNVHVVVASSSAVYPDDGVLPKVESMRAAPKSPYGASKLAVEAYLAAFHHSYGVDVLPVRLFNVYGPLQNGFEPHRAVIPAFISAALNGRRITINGDGKQTRDFTYVDTVTDVLCQAVLHRVVHVTPVNLAFGENISLLDVVEELERHVGRHIYVQHVGGHPADVRHSTADPELLRRLFPSVRPIAFPDGLARTIEWARQQYSAVDTGMPSATVNDK